jgi:hypothetical protein
VPTPRFYHGSGFVDASDPFALAINVLTMRFPVNQVKVHVGFGPD